MKFYSWSTGSSTTCHLKTLVQWHHFFAGAIAPWNQVHKQHWEMAVTLAAGLTKWPLVQSDKARKEEIEVMHAHYQRWLGHILESKPTPQFHAWNFSKNRHPRSEYSFCKLNFRIDVPYQCSWSEVKLNLKTYFFAMKETKYCQFAYFCVSKDGYRAFNFTVRFHKKMTTE